jgi:glutathione synthase/RimK-type ligase-like ATP-grasp enzyme
VILFFGRGDDTPLQLAIEAARVAGVDHVVLDQSHVAGDDFSLHLGLDGLDGRMVVAGTEIGLAQVGAVYARPLEAPPLADPIEALRARVFQAGLLEWLDSGCCPVVNRPSAMESNSSKPYQAQLIARLGFEVPDTLVSSDPDEVLAFRRHHGRVIFKSTGGVRSIVRELDDSLTARLARLRDLPTMFQAYVPGVDVRVHVVGQQVFPTEVRSDATDYRYSGGDTGAAVLRECRIPDDVADRCRNLSSGLGLPLCGIDLRRRPDGGWVCFEVNPMPAYSYYESNTGQAISTAVVTLLSDLSQERCDARH